MNQLSLRGTVPNLDALNNAELDLIDLATMGQRPGRANKLPNKVARAINEYVCDLKIARCARIVGDIGTARYFESKCAAIYSNVLPTRYRW